MSTARERDRCRHRLHRLSTSHLDCEAIRREALADLQRVIGFDRWCWPLADPSTLLPGSGIAQHDYGARVPRSLELEYSTDAFAAKHVVARRADPAASLRRETGGDLARSQRWDEAMRPAGIGDVAIVACRDALGCWGWIEAYRDRADRPFESEHLELLAEVGPAMGSALRRAAMSRTGEQATAHPAGVIVLDGELRLVSSTAAARAWIDALPSAQLYARMGILPTVVYPTAAVARSAHEAARPQALLRADDGAWVMIEAARLEGARESEIAVTLRPATVAEKSELLGRVYALTHRERELVALLVAGLDTRGIAARLFISPHTVQDHLKSVFEKTGVRSRRELLAQLGSRERASANESRDNDAARQLLAGVAASV
jgi:DNA-binding CsgD family transcriptional regulator